MLDKTETDYYNKGYFKTRLSKELIALFWTEIYQTAWVEDTYEKIYRSIPDWYRFERTMNVDQYGRNRGDFERIIGKMTKDRAPYSLQELTQKILTLDSMYFFKKYYQTAELISIDLWNGSEEIPYHFDTINGADTLVLIYLTESSSWNSCWGGKISLKKSLGDVVIYEDTYFPESGTMLVINNANPLITHQVTKLINDEVNRYTFSFNYKWF